MSVEFSDAGKRHQKLHKVEILLDKALFASGVHFQMKLVERQVKLRPATIATGQTYRSHTVSEIRTGADMRGTFRYIRVGPRTTYARWGIQSGRRPGTPPPLDAIKAWVREKPFGASLSEQKLVATAIAVQHHIAVSGTKAFLVMSTVRANERGVFKRYVRNAFVAGLKGA